MNKRDFTTVRLAQGEMHIYDFGGVKLHAYQTGDPLADEVFLLEKAGRFMVLESPCFSSSIAALGAYMEGRNVAGMLIAYHGAGASFLPEVQAPVRYGELPLAQFMKLSSTNLNTATPLELMELPGIGEVLAGRIVTYRLQRGGFASVEELREVRGIGEKRLETLRKYVYVE